MNTEIRKLEIKEERVSKSYMVKTEVNKQDVDKPFTPEIVYRDGKFSHFNLHIESGFKTKYDLKLDAEDEDIFNILKDFFKSII